MVDNCKIPEVVKKSCLCGKPGSGLCINCSRSLKDLFALADLFDAQDAEEENKL